MGDASITNLRQGSGPFIHMPLGHFARYRQKIADHRINVEILITAEDMDSQPDGLLEEIGCFLKEQRLLCTIHGPFLDLNPGSSDAKIREATQERFQQLLELVFPLNPGVIVLHAAFDPLYYQERAASWLHNSVQTWLPVAKEAERLKLKIAIENVQEKTPEIIQKLLLTVNNPYLGVCFDIGHFHLFSQAFASLKDWITTLGTRIFELHLHDNHGQFDEHLALGEGKIDIPALLTLIQEKGLSVAYTIEACSEEQAYLSLQRLASYLTRK